MKKCIICGKSAEADLCDECTLAANRKIKHTHRYSNRAMTCPACGERAVAPGGLCEVCAQAAMFTNKNCEQCDGDNYCRYHEWESQ